MGCSCCDDAKMCLVLLNRFGYSDLGIICKNCYKVWFFEDSVVNHEIKN